MMTLSSSKLLLLFLLAVSYLPHATAQQYALIADHLIDGKSNKLIKNKALLTLNRSITAIVDIDMIPDEAIRIELPGSTIMPGMINAHEHPLIYTHDYQNAHLQASSAFKALLGLSNLQSLLRSGWTTIRVMGDADIYFANQDLRKVIDDGVFVGPRLTGAAHYISITGGGGDINYLSPEQKVISEGLIADGPDEIRKAIRREIKYGSDWIKIMVTGAFMSVGDNPKNVSFSPAELAAAVQEAARHNIPVAAHAHATEGINQAIVAGVRSIEHGSFLDRESIALMVKHNTYYVPTIYVGDYYANSGKLLEQTKNDDFYLSFRDAWLTMIGEAHRAGVKIVVGSDLCGYAVASHLCAREFATLVEAGMSPMEAIKAGTSVAAELLQWDDRIGTLETGKLADIIAVTGNPIVNISALEKPVFVMKNGEIILNQLEN